LSLRNDERPPAARTGGLLLQPERAYAHHGFLKVSFSDLVALHEAGAPTRALCQHLSRYDRQ
jgi:hypothetical protein